jgi:hypothetical protein
VKTLAAVITEPFVADLREIELKKPGPPMTSSFRTRYSFLQHRHRATHPHRRIS